ncbi:MAG: prepilin-type N-terminal cleavage/methylation domain-containing protein [Oscillospiraceae bacterium]|nr:prepilin-type N-terminal cleavage/methylation domain-containing protein [Oscillospiraceae bacterium]
MKRNRIEGFTLVELIVVIAIIGILASIIIPSMIGYVRKAKIKADTATARSIFNEFSLLLVEEDEYEGFNNKKETVFDCFYSQNFKTVHSVNVNKETYDLHVVAKCAGAAPAKSQPLNGGYYHWNGNSEGAAIYKALDDRFQQSRKGKFLIRKQSTSYNHKDTDLWMLCYRVENNERQIEIWAGSSTGKWASLPVYRLYPDPAPAV